MSNRRKLFNITSSASSNYVWFRIAKTGTRSLLDILGSNTEFSIDSYSVSLRRIHRSFHDNFDIKKINKLYKIEFKPSYESAFKFTIVRNPWSRLVSCWADKIVGGGFGGPNSSNDYNYMQFKDFVKKVVANSDMETCNIHFRAQNILIDLVNIDHIARFENFENEIELILKKIGLAGVKIPHINKSHHKKYIEYYDDETIDIVAKKYKKDIEIFNYKFEEG